MNNFSVYMHTVPDGRKYVGITQRDPKRRWNSGAGYIHNWEFHKTIKNVGWGRIKHEVLYEGLSKQDAEAIEMQLIEKYNTTNPKYGFNCTKGGGYSNPTDETKKKISESTSHSLKKLGVTKPCVCVETGEVYPSLKEASCAVGLKTSAGVGNSCRSNGKFSAGGYHFLYADEKEKERIKSIFNGGYETRRISIEEWYKTRGETDEELRGC